MKNKNIYIFLIIYLINIITFSTPIEKEFEKIENNLKSNPFKKEYIKDLEDFYIKNFNDLNISLIDKLLELNSEIIDTCTYAILKEIRGSLLVKKAKYEWFLPLKYYYIYTGMLEMKHVIEEDFDNLTYRYIRAKTAYDISEYNFAHEISLKDFEYIYLRVQEKKEFLKRYDFGEVLYKLGILYKKVSPIKSQKYFNELKEYKNSIYYKRVYDEK